MGEKAIVLRMKPEGIDIVSRAVEKSELVIGWGNHCRLFDSNLSRDEVRESIRKEYCPEDSDGRRAGSAAGHVWRFIRELEIGDYVVIPHNSEFYVAKVTSEARLGEYSGLSSKVFIRDAQYLNHGYPMSRRFARAALLSRMKTQGTTARANDLIADIESCLKAAESGKPKSFSNDLKNKLVETTLQEIRSGRIESYGFERLVKDLLENMGAIDCQIIPRNQDKGADIVASFLLAGSFQMVLAVQAKHWQPGLNKVGEQVVNQLIDGINHENANLGMIVTSGEISEEAEKRAEDYFEEEGIKIEMVDGEKLALLIIENVVKF